MHPFEDLQAASPWHSDLEDYYIRPRISLAVPVPAHAPQIFNSVAAIANAAYDFKARNPRYGPAEGKNFIIGVLNQQQLASATNILIHS